MYSPFLENEYKVSLESLYNAPTTFSLHFIFTLWEILIFISSDIASKLTPEIISCLFIDSFRTYFFTISIHTYLFLSTQSFNIQKYHASTCKAHYTYYFLIIAHVILTNNIKFTASVYTHLYFTRFIDSTALSCINLAFSIMLHANFGTKHV